MNEWLTEWKKNHALQSFAEFLISNQMHTHTLTFHSVCFITIITCYYYCYFLLVFFYHSSTHTHKGSPLLLMLYTICSICKRIRFIFSAYKNINEFMYRRSCLTCTCVQIETKRKTNGNSNTDVLDLPPNAHNWKWHVQTCHIILCLPPTHPQT